MGSRYQYQRMTVRQDDPEVAMSMVSGPHSGVCAILPPKVMLGSVGALPTKPRPKARQAGPARQDSQPDEDKDDAVEIVEIDEVSQAEEETLKEPRLRMIIEQSKVTSPCFQGLILHRILEGGDSVGRQIAGAGLAKECR